MTLNGDVDMEDAEQGAKKMKRTGKKLRRGITLDSGAADPVLRSNWVNKDHGRPSSGSKAGVRYIAANGEEIKNEGMTTLHFQTAEGTTAQWEFQIAKVNKALASVSYLVDCGYCVIFNKNNSDDSSYIIHKPTGRIMKMQRVRGVYTIDAHILEPRSDKTTQCNAHDNKAKSRTQINEKTPFVRQG